MKTEKELKKYLLDLLEEENKLTEELSEYLKDNEVYSIRFSKAVHRKRTIKGIRIGILYSMDREDCINE